MMRRPQFALLTLAVNCIGNLLDRGPHWLRWLLLALVILGWVHHLFFE